MRIVLHRICYSHISLRIAFPKKVHTLANQSHLEQHLTGGTFKASANDAFLANRLLEKKLVISNRKPIVYEKTVDWNSNPFLDNNWRFNLHSLRWADPLRRQWLSTNNEALAREYKEILFSWYKFHFIDKKTSQYSWYDMAAGLRVKVFLAAKLLFPDDNWIDEALYAHGQKLSSPKYLAVKGNHGLHAMVGLLICGDIHGNEQWKDASVQRITELFDMSIDEDGVDFEGALQYQRNNYSWYSEAANHIRLATGIEPPFDSRLQKMLDFLVHTVTTAGRHLQYGDTDLIRNFRSFDNENLEWAKTLGRSGTPPKDSYKAFVGGHAFGRTSWKPEDFETGISYSIRFGPSYKDTSHGHRDAGALTLSHGNRDLIFDAGRYRYDSSDESKYLKSPEAHSVLTLENHDYGDDTTADLVINHSQSSHDWTVISREFDKNSTWNRGVLHVRRLRSLVVIDEVFTNDLVTVKQHWQLGRYSKFLHGVEDTIVDTPTQGLEIKFDWPAQGSIKRSTHKGERSPMYGWRSVKHGEIFSAPILKVESTGTRIRLVTVISIKDERENHEVFTEYDQINSKEDYVNSWMGLKKFKLFNDESSVLINLPKSIVDLSTDFSGIVAE